MKITKSTFIKNYKNKVTLTESDTLEEAIHYAFKLTDEYGILRINKAILESSIKYKVDETELREKINNASFMLNERNKK